jgi:hypothetical protein
MKAPSPFSLEKSLVNVAPAPLFARLEGFDDWVIGQMKMLGGVLIFGRVAAADVAADQANP